jgi:hypothetical protein
MSLGDFWDNQVPGEWRTETMATIRQCSNLDWLILTKRPQNIPKDAAAGLGGRTDGRMSGLARR